MDRSFREVLAKLLQEEAPLSEPTFAPPKAQSRPAQELYEFPFSWRAPHTPPKKSTYPTPAPRPKAQPKPEILCSLADLGAVEKGHAETLIRLGALELMAGLSQARLKKAYRRLAKKLHPDRSPGTAADFMELQKAYEALVSAISASNRDSECASGPKSRRPAAA